MRPTVLLLLSSALASGCHHGKPAVERRPSPAASSPAPQPLGLDRVVAPGSVEPLGGEVRLAAQESGWLAEILVREGQAVEAGALLARLDDEPQRSAVELARAEVAEAEALAQKLERGSTAEQIAELRAAHEGARARAQLGEREADRAERLLASGALRAAEAERARAEASALDAEGRAAQARLLSAQRGPRREERRAAAERLSAARARLALAEAALARRAVRSPAGGTVLVSRFHAGEHYTPPAGPLLILGDLRSLQVRLEVDEIDAPRVAPGMACELFDDAGQLVGRGSVARLAPKVGRRALLSESPTDRTDLRVREVFVEVPPADRLVPGQRVWGHALLAPPGAPR